MKTKKALLWGAILCVVLWTLFDASNRPTQAQSASGSENEPVISRLENLLSNQKIIMSDLASIKEELRIIKIRITQQQ
jgi:hypothetical protein